MAAVSPPAPAISTGQQAQSVAGYDPAPVIAAQEQSLQDYLNLPVKEILDRLGLPPAAGGRPADEAPPEAQPEDAPAQGSPMDPSSLISPVTDALGTLGNGLFEGQDPTAMFDGISQTFDSTGNSLNQALGGLNGSWQGDSATAAEAKTAKAIANGAEVGRQADALRSSLATAAADVAQARVRLIEIISEFQATIAAIGPNIIFPWGWAAAIAAANKAIATTAEVMTELQSSLSAQAAATTAAGMPVDVTDAPALGSAAAAPATGLGSAGLASPLMSMAPQALSAGLGAASAAAQAGTAAAQANQSEEQKKAKDPAAPMTSAAASGVPRPSAGSGGGAAGSGGPNATSASKAIPLPPMPQSETPTTESVTTRAAMSGSTGATGGGMMGGAPMTPFGARPGAEGSHTSPSFLHTTDQGGEIVGDLGTAAPPVLGEADPTERPDVDLRI